MFWYIGTVAVDNVDNIFCEIESHYSVDIYDKDDYQIPYKYLAEFFELHIIVIIVM